jgi:hypothetical protein
MCRGMVCSAEDNKVFLDRLATFIYRDNVVNYNVFSLADVATVQRVAKELRFQSFRYVAGVFDWLIRKLKICYEVG